MKKERFLQILNLVTIIAVVLVNILANVLPLNGRTTGEISDRFEVFFVPAGYAFSIWVLIYLGLLAFAVYQVFSARKNDPLLQRIGYWFVVSNLANISWIFFWHFELFPLSLVAMLILLVSLVAIYLRLDIGRREVSPEVHWLVDVPFSIYLSWITVATISNVTVLLDYLNWTGWGIAPEIWMVVMLTAGVAITLIVSITRGDIAYLLVILWAYLAIAVKQSEPPVVSLASWIATIVVAVIAAINIFHEYWQS